MDEKELHKIVGTEIPNGEYVITEDNQNLFLQATFSPEIPKGLAHPSYGHLATHCGKGWSLAEFVSYLDVPIDSGLLFGGGKISFSKPLETSIPYLVKARISKADRKEGSQTGVFDRVTVTSQLYDINNVLSCQADETFIIPRSEATKNNSSKKSPPRSKPSCQKSPQSSEMPKLLVPTIGLKEIETVMKVMNDINPVHTDFSLAHDLGLRGPVNQGPSNLAYMFNCLLQWGIELESLKNVEFQFHNISCPGDDLTVTGYSTSTITHNNNYHLQCSLSLDVPDEMINVAVATADLILSKSQFLKLQ